MFAVSHWRLNAVDKIFMELLVFVGAVEKLKLGTETWKKCWLQ